MSNKHQPRPDSDQSTIYHIRIKEGLGQQWQDWFEGMTITREENGESVIAGHVEDQAQLFGLLKKVRNLGLTLLSVTPVNADDN